MNVLLVEDDVDLGQAVAEHLESAGHHVYWCKLLAQARQHADAELALLDLNLPDGDGLALLREWRAAAVALPVIVLTARDELSDRIGGLQAGADDYLVKPFDLDELLARIEAVSRRSALPPRVTVGRADIDFEARSLRQDGLPVELTALEWAVIGCLTRRPGRIVPKGEIEDRLADQGLLQGESNSLEVIVSRLRKKLGAAAITTHRGMGYRFDG